MTEDNRDYGLDFLKIIFCFMILLLHKPTALGFWHYLPIRSFVAIAVPGFFAISGYLLVMRGDITRKVYTKIIPRYVSVFLLWSSAYWVTNWVREHDGWDGFLFFIVENSEGWHLWYLKCLIQILLFYPLLRAIVEKKNLFILYTVFWFILVGIRFIFTYIHPINWYYLRLLQVPLFEMSGFVAGTWSGYYPEEALGLVLIGGGFIYHIKQMDNPKKCNGLFILMYLFGLLTTIMLGVYEYFKMPENALLGIMEPFNGYLLISVCGFMGFVLSNVTYSDWMKRVIQFLAPLTLGVYCIHPLVIRLVKHYYDLYARTYDALLYFLVAFISFAIIWVMRVVIPRKMRAWIL